MMYHSLLISNREYGAVQQICSRNPNKVVLILVMIFDRVTVCDTMTALKETMFSDFCSQVAPVVA